MKKFIPLFLLLGCHGVVRDETVYQAEVGFMEQAATQEADSLISLIQTYCKCDADHKFTTPACDAAAKKAMVVKSRIPWHVSMMLYNARLIADRPSAEPPAITSPSTLCPQ